MQKSLKPTLELEKARNLISLMHTASAHEEFEELWREFLSKLERTWNKAQDHYKKSPKWDGWKGKYVKERKEDPLLKYLINARGADEHTIGEIVEPIPAQLTISSPTGGVAINRISISNGQVHIYSTHSDQDAILRVGFTPNRTKLLSIKNRGVNYNPPELHLGKRIDLNNVIQVAELGAEYYEGFINSAEQYFSK